MFYSRSELISVRMRARIKRNVLSVAQSKKRIIISEHKKLWCVRCAVVGTSMGTECSTRCRRIKVQKMRLKCRQVNNCAFSSKRLKFNGCCAPHVICYRFCELRYMSTFSYAVHDSTWAVYTAECGKFVLPFIDGVGHSSSIYVYLET